MATHATKATNATNATNATSTSLYPTDQIVGWSAGPDSRGTLNIIWSSLATIFACTWRILHLNIPGFRDGPWTIKLRKVKWMAMTVLFPEFVFVRAIEELKMALDDLLTTKEKEAKISSHRPELPKTKG
jgi:hypothetical protein